MIRLRHKLFIYALRLFDQALLVVTLLVCLVQFGLYQGTGDLQRLCQNYYDPRAGVGLALLGLCWGWIFDTFVDYQTNRLRSLKTKLFDVVKANSASAFLLMVIATVFTFKRINKELILTFWITTCILGMLGRLLLRLVLMMVRRSGYNFRHL